MEVVIMGGMGADRQELAVVQALNIRTGKITASSHTVSSSVAEPQKFYAAPGKF
jgi:hypothetical protein